mgnify:FL=1
MNQKHQIKITTRDRLMRGWGNSMELVRDFENYAKEIEDDRQASALFAQFAGEEGVHAAKFHEILHNYDA